METAVKRLYEGLFLIDSADAAADWQGMMGVIEKILSRAEAEVVSLRKWDERKLAYDIRGKSRGTYILAYFNCDTSKITGIERDVQLSEKVMRVIILRTDKMSKEEMEKATPAVLAERGIVSGGTEAQKTASTGGVEAAEGGANYDRAEEAEGSVSEDTAGQEL